MSDLGWLREATRAAGFFMPCPVRVFSNRDRGVAIEWLAQLPGSTALNHRLIPESGVIVVEVTRALKPEDFDALGATADAWIEHHDRLNGLVLHAHHFPGWEKAGSLFRHIRFVRDHHKKVKRVALAAESKLAELMPRLAEQFVDAEVKSFGYDDLNAAITWASEPAASPSAGA